MTAVKRNDRAGEWWADFRWKGRRIRAKAPLQSKRGAEQLERHLRHQFSKDEDHGMDPFAGPPPKFAEFAERWMKTHVAPRNKLATQIEKRSYLKHHLLPAFGRQQLDAIGTKDIEAFVATKVDAGLSAKSINNILARLRSALNVAHNWRLVRSVPRIEALKVPDRQYTWLSADDLDRLIGAATPGYWRALVTFIVDTGVRFGEAAGLRWDRLYMHGEPPLVTIDQAAFQGRIGSTKTGRVRRIPLTPRIVRELAALPYRGELVFERMSGGAPRPDSTLDTLHRMCDRASVQRIGWHALRHSYATLLCQRGVPLRNVQELLGHTTMIMTSRYAHASPTDTAHWVYHALVPASELATDALSTPKVVTRWPPSAPTSAMRRPPSQPPTLNAAKIPA